jgi:hypothetical protein
MDARINTSAIRPQSPHSGRSSFGLVRGPQNLVAGATLITLLDHPISATLLVVALITLTLALLPTIRKRDRGAC